MLSLWRALRGAHLALRCAHNLSPLWLAQVQIGSYPNVVNDQDAEAAGWRTRLAFTSRDAQALAAALAAAREAMPHLSEEAPQPRKERHGT